MYIQRALISAKVRKQYSSFQSQSIYDCYEQDESGILFDSCLNKRLFSLAEMDDEFEKKICCNQVQDYMQLQQYALPQIQNVVQIACLKKDDQEIELNSFAKSNQNDFVSLDDFKLLSIDEVNYIQCLEESEKKGRKYVQKKKQSISKNIHKLKF